MRTGPSELRDGGKHGVAMTANAMPGDEDLCLAAGMDGYVSKPINIQELFSVVKSVIPTQSA